MDHRLLPMKPKKTGGGTSGQRGPGGDAWSSKRSRRPGLKCKLPSAARGGMDIFRVRGLVGATGRGFPIYWGNQWDGWDGLGNDHVSII